MIRWLVAALVGAVVCTVLDHQHVTFGVLWYPTPVFWQQAWWVPILFGTATLAALGAAEPLRRAFGGERVEASRGRLAIDFVVFAAAYFSTAVWQARPTLLAIVLGGVWLARAPFLPRWVIVASLASAVIGPAFEATWSHLGFFYYHHPDTLGVARWLPMLYLHVGVIAATVSSIVVRNPERVPGLPRRAPPGAWGRPPERRSRV
jgi:hypothetical protein